MRTLEPLREDQIRAALEDSLADLGARLELIDYLRAPVPVGKLEFPRSGLGRAPAGAGSIWRGSVRHGAGRTFPVWARVRVQVPRSRVVALRDLAAGRPVEPDSVEVRTVEGPPSGEPDAATIEEVVGRLPRRTIAAGMFIERRTLALRRDIEAGTVVEVEVRSGAARLTFQGKAESGGRIGDSIVIRNPQTGKRLRAVVEGQGKVSVDEAPNSADVRPGGGRLGSQETR